MKEQYLKAMCRRIKLIKRAIVGLKEEDIVVPINGHGPWQDTAELEGLQEAAIGIKFLQLEDASNIDIPSAVHCQGHNLVEKLPRETASFPKFQDKGAGRGIEFLHPNIVVIRDAGISYIEVAIVRDRHIGRVSELPVASTRATDVELVNAPQR